MPNRQSDRGGTCTGGSDADTEFIPLFSVKSLTCDVNDTAISCGQRHYQNENGNSEQEDKGPEIALVNETEENDEVDWENDGSESEELMDQESKFKKIDLKLPLIVGHSLIADWVKMEFGSNVN